MTDMKHLLPLLCICFFLPTTLFAQKIAVNKTDEFTGIHVVKSAPARLAANMINIISYQWGAGQEADTLAYGLQIDVVKTKPFFVMDNTHVYFLLQDKTVITGTAAERDLAEKGKGHGSALEGFGVEVVYVFDNFDWVSVENPVTKIRIETSDGLLDMSVKASNAAKFAKAYFLVKQTMEP